MLATTFGGSIAVVKLGRDEVEVEKVWKSGEVGHGRIEGGRELRGKVNGINGNSLNHDKDEESADEEEEDSSMDVDEDITSESDREALLTTVVALAVTADGQYLASADLGRRVSVFDLSTLKVCFVRLHCFPSFDVN